MPAQQRALKYWLTEVQMLTQRERVRDTHIHIKIYHIFYPTSPKGQSLLKKQNKDLKSTIIIHLLALPEIYVSLQFFKCISFLIITHFMCKDTLSQLITYANT